MSHKSLKRTPIFLVGWLVAAGVVACGTDDPLPHGEPTPPAMPPDGGGSEEEEEKGSEAPGVFEEPQPGWVLLDRSGERVVLSGTAPTAYPGERLEGYTFENPNPSTSHDGGVCFIASGTTAGPLSYVHRYDLETGRPEPCYGGMEEEFIQSRFGDESCTELVYLVFSDPRRRHFVGPVWKRDGQLVGVDPGDVQEVDGYFLSTTDAMGGSTCTYFSATQSGREQVFVAPYKCIPESILERFEAGAPYRLVWR